MRIRPATAADRDEWARMRQAVYGDTVEAQAADVDALLSLRAWAEGCITSPVGYLEGIWVEERARRSGVAGRLVNAAEDWARNRGCTEMASDAALDNHTSLEVHRALGFEEVERAVLFRKDL